MLLMRHTVALLELKAGFLNSSRGSAKSYCLRAAQFRQLIQWLPGSQLVDFVLKSAGQQRSSGLLMQWIVVAAKLRWW